MNSLHTVWDTCIIEKKLGTDPQTVARDLLDGLPESDKTAWAAIPIEGWANESFQVTRRKSVGYCVRASTKCVYQQGNETFTEGEEEKVVVVNATYLEQHVPFIRARLKRAGIRLAHLLNTTLGSRQASGAQIAKEAHMPTLRITIDIFSGRPNPVIELSGRPAREALALLKAARTTDKRESDLPPVPTLGYRGLIIEEVGARRRAPVRTMDQALEDFICGSTGLLRRLKIGRDFPSLLRKEIDRFRDLRQRWPRPYKIRWPVRIRCRCAPLYEPAWWNDGGQRQLRNNCYNYASNYRTDTFHQIPGGSQPGAAAGAMYTQLTCASVRPAAVADGLIARRSANNRCPAEGHLVALVIAPGIDFHWYRKGRNGYWSHKPGTTPVINLDNSNHLIPDPRTADRGMYTQFCTFMIVMHGHIKIR